LRHGAREGCKIAVSPLITDAPVIAVALFAAAKLAQLRPLLGVVSFAGGIFVLYLAWEGLRPAQADPAQPAQNPNSWLKGIVTNLLSPHPWLFWLTVGAASLANALRQGWIPAAAFLAGFYLLLVGCKIAVAIIVGRSRQALARPAYRIIMRILSVLLACFAVLLFREGVRNLGFK
jgi:threonine/homoserine/homoserine lactone efflux protein